MADNRMVLTLVAAAVAWAGAGCGGVALKCGEVSPCGGDVVGTWTMSGSCYNDVAANAEFAADCPGGSVDLSEWSIVGNLTFNSDLTYSSTAMLMAKGREVIPLSCLDGVVTTCAELTAIFQQVPGATVTCTGSTTCTCDLDVSQPFLGAGGTYSSSGTVLQTTGTDGSLGDGGDYCVQDRMMHVLDVSMIMNMGPMGQATIISDAVGVKQ